MYFATLLKEYIDHLSLDESWDFQANINKMIFQ